MATQFTKETSITFLGQACSASCSVLILRLHSRYMHVKGSRKYERNISPSLQTRVQRPGPVNTKAKNTRPKGPNTRIMYLVVHYCCVQKRRPHFLLSFRKSVLVDHDGFTGSIIHLKPTNARKRQFSELAQANTTQRSAKQHSTPLSPHMRIAEAALPRVSLLLGRPANRNSGSCRFLSRPARLTT